jgi:hypothetical protein
MNDEPTKTSIKGFAYSVEEDLWIISEEPHLKSCCIGHFEKVSQTWVIHPKTPLPSDVVIELNGIPGQYRGNPALFEAELIQRDTKDFSALALIGISLLLLVTWLASIGRPKKAAADSKNCCGSSDTKN